MGETTEVGKRIEAPSYSQEAKKALEKLGISFKPANHTDIYRITSRDIEGGSYLINAGALQLGLPGEIWVLEKDGVEIGYYWWRFKKDIKIRKQIGEVGMVHLAPALREKGLGSLILLLGYLQTVEAGAGDLRALVGDETGKMEGLMKKLGFSQVNEKWISQGHTLWRMNVSNRKEIAASFSQKFKERIEKIKPEDLKFNPEEVDIDNPRKVSIKETVMRRLNERGCYFDGKVRPLFGYDYAPIFIFQENLKEGFTRLMLRAEGKKAGDQEVLEEGLQQVFPEESLKIDWFPNIKAKPPTWQIKGPRLKEKKEIRQYTQKLAEASEGFFNRVHLTS